MTMHTSVSLIDCDSEHLVVSLNLFISSDLLPKKQNLSCCISKDALHDSLL